MYFFLLQLFDEIESFCNITNVFNVTFDQFNMLLMNKKYSILIIKINYIECVCNGSVSCILFSSKFAI